LSGKIRWDFSRKVVGRGTGKRNKKQKFPPPQKPKIFRLKEGRAPLKARESLPEGEAHTKHSPKTSRPIETLGGGGGGG